MKTSLFKQAFVLFLFAIALGTAFFANHQGAEARMMKIDCGTQTSPPKIKNVGAPGPNAGVPGPYAGVPGPYAGVPGPKAGAPGPINAGVKGGA